MISNWLIQTVVIFGIFAAQLLALNSFYRKQSTLSKQMKLIARQTNCALKFTAAHNLSSAKESLPPAIQININESLEARLLENFLASLHKTMPSNCKLPGTDLVAEYYRQTNSRLPTTWPNWRFKLTRERHE